MFEYDPQAVIARYQVRAGSEAEFETICAEAWQLYRKLDLIQQTSHVVLRGRDESGAPCYLELVPWKDRSVTGNPPSEVVAIWNRLQALCEARPGHNPIEFPDFQVSYSRDR